MKNLKKIKKLYLLLLLPLIVATQCEDEITFQTDYVVQNDTSIDLIFVSQTDFQLVIESGDSFVYGSNFSDNDNPRLPSSNQTNIILHRLDGDNLVIAYEQNPINDDLWILSEEQTEDYKYVLNITDDLIN